MVQHNRKPAPGLTALSRHPHSYVSKLGNSMASARFFVPGDVVPPLPNALQAGDLLLPVQPWGSSDHLCTPGFPPSFPRGALIKPPGTTLVMLEISETSNCALLFIKIFNSLPLSFFLVNGLGKEFFLYNFLCTLPLFLCPAPVSTIRAPSPSQHLQLFSPPNQCSSSPTFHNVILFFFFQH